MSLNQLRMVATKLCSMGRVGRLASRAGAGGIILLLLALPGFSWAQFDVPVVKFSVKSFLVEGDNPLSVEKTHEILKEFLGDHAGVEGLQAAADELEAEMAKAGYSFHRVTLPPQRALGGEIKLKVLTFSLGQINVIGNKNFSPENIIASVPALMEGQIPNDELIGEQLEFANEHPSKQVAVTFKDSEETDAVDANIQVQDVDPFQIYTLISNTGSSATGIGRLSIGLINANVAGLDHQVSASYTTSPGHWEDVQQAGLNYKLPFYGHQTDLSFSATYSNVDSGQVAGLFDVTGSGITLGAKLRHMLPKIGSYRHSVSLSLDDKVYNNDINFAGTPLGTDVESQPITINYTASFSQPNYNLGLALDYLVNTEIGEKNRPIDYTNSRAGATHDWEAYKVSLSGDVTMDSWVLKGSVSAQMTNDMLISGEQFGFGGSTGPRGLDEREVSGDEGYAWSVELWSPKIREAVNVLAFYDHGSARVRNPAAGVDPKESVDTTGLGLRANLTETTTLSLDWGYVLNGGTTTVTNDSRIHGSLFHRF